MTASAATLPDFNQRPPDATPSAITLQARRLDYNRRTVLRLVVGGAIGLGLATLDMISRALPARATNPNPILSVWSDCSPAGFFAPSTICVPTSAYYGGGTPGVCAGTWHRNDRDSTGPVTFNFTFNNTSCSNRNAWRWTSGTRRKCSDGHTIYNSGTVHRNTFSICRTAI